MVDQPTLELSEEWQKQIYHETTTAIQECLAVSALEEGDIFVVGCSSSEICGERIGSGSSLAVANVVFEAISSTLAAHGIALAAQCCEHLNRALIVEADVVRRYQLEIVNAIPQPKAGGSFSTAAYRHFTHPVAVESLRAKAAAGIDIGDTLIGMHIHPVVVPSKIKTRRIGQANVVAARRRPKFVGGSRAVYDERIL